MAAPVNTVLPAVTGTPEVGQTLTVDNGSWDVVPTSYAYAWLRGATVIAGETLATYTVTLADIGYTLKARVTATNVDGSTPADSAATAEVPSTLVVEDGSCLATADSFIGLDDADAYHVKRGNADWAALSAADKESALRRATDYMEQRYSDRWKGVRMTFTQALEWPRKYVPRIGDGYVINDPGTDYWWPETEVPAPVQNACAELALRASSITLSPDLERAVIREKVGPIDITYESGSREAVEFKAIDEMLRRFLISDDGFMGDAER